MIAVSSLTDFREEMYVSLFRRWLVIDQLGRNTKDDLVLTMQKGALFDYLLKNPKDMHSFLVAFNRLNENSPYDDVLYSNDAEFGSYQEVTDFLEGALILEAEGYIEITINGADCYISSKSKLDNVDTTLVEGWKLSLSLLKPLVSKSLNVLQKNSLR
ncbi:hypothetical protein HBN70_17130 [Pseudomonas lundensis]|uniref:hypothetical protein n=1 Tax=Pseudomonas lundensis TaxID=86185 RepID=UPI00147416CC|nr:hypothetical protein [Pseudomonas lundensis]NNA22466.1 hypothetical protein [Pseudomonas lundensis]